MTDFYTLWTDTGLTKLGDATLETPFNITMAVVGDGNGADVIPNKGQVDLVNQVWSGAIGSKVRSKSDPNTIVFEFAIPAADGPFTIREVGLKSDDGQLCIVGNFPVTEKPVAADGSVRDMILRLPVHFENADVVNLVFDPNVVTATKADVLAHSLKQLDPTDTDEVKEKHLSNFQAKVWQDHKEDGDIHVTTTQKINWSIYSNCPGDFIFLPYAPTAQQMLDRRILEGNGGSVLDTDYPDILVVWGGKIYGNVDATHFNLPPLSGYFPRFWDHGAGIASNAANRTNRGDGTSGDKVGTLELDEIKAHNHSFSRLINNILGAQGGTSFPVTVGPDSTGSTGGLETRPKNIFIWGGIFY